MVCGFVAWYEFECWCDLAERSVALAEPEVGVVVSPLEEADGFDGLHVLIGVGWLGWGGCLTCGCCCVLAKKNSARFAGQSLAVFCFVGAVPGWRGGGVSVCRWVCS